MYDSVWHTFGDLQYTRELGGYRRVVARDSRGHVWPVGDYAIVGDITLTDEIVLDQNGETLKQIERRTVEVESPEPPHLVERFRIDGDTNEWFVERYEDASDVGNLVTFHLMRSKRKNIRPAGATS